MEGRYCTVCLSGPLSLTVTIPPSPGHYYPVHVIAGDKSAILTYKEVSIRVIDAPKKTVCRLDHFINYCGTQPHGHLVNMAQAQENCVKTDSELNLGS